MGLFSHRAESDGSGDEPGSDPMTKIPDITTTALPDDVDLSRDLRSDPEARAAFLAMFTAEEERSIMRKVDLRFLSIIGLMFMVKNIDQSNISIIKTLQIGQPTNIMTQLHMTSDQYNWVATVQGIPYIIFELPSNLVLKYMTPHAWESRIFLTWGIATACGSVVRNQGQLIAVRFLVGMFEAGMFPGVITTLSYWYRTDEVGRPMLWFFWISNLSSIVGSLICYGASFMDGMRGLSGWSWVFILEGVATILFAGVIYVVLPDFPKSPRSRKWLTPREQQFLEARLPPHAPATADPSWSTREAWAALRSPVVWAFLFDQTLMNVATYALSWYLPTIITNLGFVGLPTNVLLNLPPAAASIAAMSLWVVVTSRGWAPRPLVCVAMVVGAIVCFVLFITVRSRGGLYAACVLSQLFVSSYYVPYWSWRSSVLSGTTGAAFAIGLQSSIAQVGGAVSPQLFRAKYAHDHYRTSFVIGLCIVAVGLLFNLWTWWLTRDIERRVVQVRRANLRDRRAGRAFTGETDIDVLSDKRIKKWW